MKKKNKIKILSEKTIPYVELNMEMDEHTNWLLIDYATQNILYDFDALLNWAFVDIITKSIEGLNKTHNKRDKKGRFCK
jgi:hypothetical protein